MHKCVTGNVRAVFHGIYLFQYDSSSSFQQTVVWMLVNTLTMFEEPEVSTSLFLYQSYRHYPDSKLHGANMGPIWGQKDPAGPHFGPMNFII